MMLRYNEAELVERLECLDRLGKTAFASACAQWLLPLFERYAASAGVPELSDKLDAALSAAWGAAEGELSLSSTLQIECEALVPSDEEAWMLETGYGQNAAAATAYAVRAWLTDVAQEAAWAARQLYEAADYAVLQAAPDLNLNAPDTNERVLSSSVVQQALTTINSVLAAVEARPRSYRALREWCDSNARVWAAGLP